MAEQEHDSRYCDVPGCFLPGSMKVAGSPWRCQFHSGAQASDMAGITLRMKNRESEILAVHADLVAPFSRRGGNTASDWSRLVRECRAPQSQTGLGVQDLKAKAAGE